MGPSRLNRRSFQVIESKVETEAGPHACEAFEARLKTSCFKVLFFQ